MNSRPSDLLTKKTISKTKQNLHQLLNSYHFHHTSIYLSIQPPFGTLFKKTHHRQKHQPPDILLLIYIILFSTIKMKSHTLLRFLYSAISLLTTLDPIHATTLHPPRGLQAMSNVQGSLNPGYVPNSGISNSSSPSPLIINQSNSGQIGISNPNWHEKIKSYLSVEVTSLPGLQPFVNDLNHDWGTSSTTSKTQSSIPKTSNSITKTCDSQFNLYPFFFSFS